MKYIKIVLNFFIFLAGAYAAIVFTLIYLNVNGQISLINSQLADLQTQINKVRTEVAVEDYIFTHLRKE